MLNKKWTDFIFYTQMIAFLLLLAVTVYHKQPPLFDEVGFVRNIYFFWESGLSRNFLLEMTDQAPGPLYQFVHTIFSPLTHLETPGIRLVNITLLFAIICIICMINRRLGNDSLKKSITVAASVMSVPMIWQVSGLALTEIPAMFFAILATLVLIVAIRNEGKAWQSSLLALSAGICLGLSILGRTPFLVLLIAGSIFILGNFRNLARWRILLICSTTALAVSLSVFIVWGGLVPPHQKTVNADGLSLWHGILAFAYGGLLMLILAPRWFIFNRNIVFGAIGLYFAFFLMNEYCFQYEYAPLNEALKKIFPASFMNLYPLLMSPLLAVLALYFILCSLVQGWNNREKPFFIFLLVSGMLLLASTFSITHLFSTRYVAQAAPFFVLVANGYDKDGIYRWVRCLIGIIIGFLSLETYFFFQ